MDYQKEYILRNPDYHRSDAPRKLADITRTYKGTPRSAIDIGCGVGYLTTLLYKYYAPKKMTGLDISRIAIKQAKLQNTKIDYYAEDLLKVSLQEKYDIAFVSDLLEHVADEKVFLDKITKIGRSAVLRVPLEDNLVNNLFKLLRLSDQFKSSRERYGHIHFYNTSSLLKLFKENDIEISTFRIFPLAKRSKWYFEMIRILGLVFWAINKSIAADIFGAFIVCVIHKTNGRKNY